MGKQREQPPTDSKQDGEAEAKVIAFRLGQATVSGGGTICYNTVNLHAFSLLSEMNLMDSQSSSMRDLARQSLAACQTASGSHIDEAAVVVEKLRLTMIKFAGNDGFVSLMRRALVLARVEVPALKFVKIDADGHLEGLEQIVAGQTTDHEAVVTLLSHLLGLLVTFIGEPLTVGLVRAAWPDTSLNGEHSRIEPHS